MERGPEALPDPMTPPDDLTRTLRHVLARHQRQVIRRSLLASALLLGCVALGWWRLSAAGVATAWKAGLLCVGLAGLALWQGFLLRRDWLSAGQLTMQLDRALGLQARLVTAAEFAGAAEPPALYGVLVQETQQALTDVSSRLPRATGRSTWLLAALLLLLWLWPHRGAPLAQLAMRSPEPPAQIPPAPPPPEPPKDQPPQQPQNQQNPSASGQGSSGSQGQQSSSSPSQEGSNQSKASPQGQQGEASKSPSGASAPSDSKQGQDQQGRQLSQRGSQDGQPQPKDGKDGGSQQQQPSGSGAQQQAASSSDQKTTADKRQGKSGGSAQQGGSKRDSASSAKAGTSPGEAAEQAALKGDIQQLLKELSGELQTLQAQGLIKPSEQAPSLPGTATDPKLYDDTAEPLASTTGGRPLSIALDVDTQATSKTRRGGGTATPSGDISDAPPQQAEEAVTLADAPTESAAGSRQAIPPEYQPVFERLSQHHDASSKP